VKCLRYETLTALASSYDEGKIISSHLPSPGTEMDILREYPEAEAGIKVTILHGPVELKAHNYSSINPPL
jgi:hypothetical protein